MALLGWQGFCFEHPDDWAPVALTGDRKEGYARLAGEGRQACQIRWKTLRRRASAGEEDHASVLTPYLNRLESDAKRKKEQFRSETEREPGRILYRWTASEQGRGAVFASGNRTFILEVTGGRKDSLLPLLRGMLSSFAADEELWSLFGLQVRLPVGLELERKDLFAGRTTLHFRGRGVRVRCERWAFCRQLLEKNSLEDWARAALEMKAGTAAEEGAGLRLASRRLLRPREALVRRDDSRNQILLIEAIGTNQKWRPVWDWLR